jgi:hypothetical protein
VGQQSHGLIDPEWQTTHKMLMPCIEGKKTYGSIIPDLHNVIQSHKKKDAYMRTSADWSRGSSISLEGRLDSSIAKSGIRCDAINECWRVCRQMMHRLSRLITTVRNGIVCVGCNRPLLRRLTKTYFGQCDECIVVWKKLTDRGLKVKSLILPANGRRSSTADNYVQIWVSRKDSRLSHAKSGSSGICAFRREWCGPECYA